jgi:hypothetical protein
MGAHGRELVHTTVGYERCGVLFMPNTPDKPASDSSVRNDAREERAGSTALYRDRPTDDGMKGDGAQEPNEGTPKLPKAEPSREAFRKRRVEE